MVNKEMCMFRLLHRPAALPRPHSTSLFLPSSLPTPSHKSLEIRAVNDPTVASKCPREWKSGTSLTINQKPAMAKLSEEGTSKAETDQKLGLSYPTA